MYNSVFLLKTVVATLFLTSFCLSQEVSAQAPTPQSLTKAQQVAMKAYLDENCEKKVYPPNPVFVDLVTILRATDKNWGLAVLNNGQTSMDKIAYKSGNTLYFFDYAGQHCGPHQAVYDRPVTSEWAVGETTSKWTDAELPTARPAPTATLKKPSTRK
ncbi:MAG: hypothetical protein AB7F59_01305 [Bdellovibrionales bacterium]